MKKEVKKCINYYRKYINSNEYKEYKEKSLIEGKKIHQEYIEKEKPEWKQRNDFYQDYHVCGISLCDVLSNDGVSKLLRKIYKLPKNKYKVNAYYKKPGIIKKYDYVHLKYSSSSHGKFAEIKFLDDKYIDSVSITWTQINNYYGFFNYHFELKRCMDEQLYDQFILDRLDKFKSNSYLIWYYIQDDNEDNFMSIDQMNSEYFPLIFQNFITSKLYSEQGKNHQLINLTYFTRKEPIEIDNLYLGDICESYYNKKSNFVITSDSDEVNYVLKAGNNHIPYFDVVPYIAKYGNELYYYLFGHRELRLFEGEFSRFVTGRKGIYYNKSFKKLLNKTQSISNIHTKMDKDIYTELGKEWAYYIANDEKDFSEHTNISLDDYKSIYNDNFSYLKLISEMNYTKSNHINTIVATIVAIIAAVISIIDLL